MHTSEPRAVEVAVPHVPEVAPEPTRGAVPVPGEYTPDEVPIEQVDRTVQIADLPLPDAAWKRRATIGYSGRVVIALHLAGNSLELAVLDTVTETPTGYAGSLEGFQLGGADGSETPQTSNTFPPRDVDPTTREYVGPVMFAVRLRSGEGAPESSRRQLVVYTRGKAIFVAEKLVTATTWTPSMRIDAPKAGAFVAMDPGWH